MALNENLTEGQIKLLGKNILLQIEEPTTGVFKLHGHMQEKPNMGMVCYVGDGELLSTDEKQNRIPVKIGDKVCFNKWNAKDFELNGVKYLLITTNDILGIMGDKNLELLGTNLLLKVEEPNYGGLIFTESVKEKQSEGIVCYVGNGESLIKDEKPIAMPVSIGDKVYFHKWNAKDFELNGMKYLLLTTKDIIAMDINGRTK